MPRLKKKQIKTGSKRGSVGGFGLLLTPIEKDENGNYSFFYYDATKKGKPKKIKGKIFAEVRNKRKEVIQNHHNNEIVLNVGKKENIQKVIRKRSPFLPTREKLIHAISEMLIRGHSYTNISNYMAENYDIDQYCMDVYIKKARKYITESVYDEIEKVIPTHLSRYERIFRELREMGLSKLPLRVMRAKERMLKLHDIQRHIVITKNDKRFITNKLTEAEFESLSKTIKKIGINEYTKGVNNNVNFSIATVVPKRQAEIGDINEDFFNVLRRKLYTNSFYHFFLDAYKVLHEGERFDDNWHIRFLCNTLQNELVRIIKGQPREKDIIINVPFRSTKSMICTVIFPVWCWIVRKQIKIISCSYAESISAHHSTQSKNILNSEWFKEVFGEDFITLKKDENTKTHYTNTRGGFRNAIGAGGAVTGKGGDIIILDDPQNPKKGASEKERQNTIDFYTATLYSRLNQPDIGVRIIIQQRLHENDLTGYLVQNDLDNYRWIKIPAEITEKTKPHPLKLEQFYEDGLFFPKRFSRKVIDGFKKVLGSYQAAGQLQQEPAPDEGGVFKRSWFTIINAQDLDFIRDVKKHPMKFYIDTAETAKQKEKGDYTAILSCFKYDNKIYITNVTQVKKEFSDLVKFIPNHLRIHQYDQYSQLKIEPKSSGKSVVSQLRQETELNVMELPSPTDDKVTRASSIQPKVESRRVVLVEGAWNSPFLDQVTIFPNSTNDDMVDVFVYAVEDLLGGGGFDFAFI